LDEAKPINRRLKFAYTSTLPRIPIFKGSKSVPRIPQDPRLICINNIYIVILVTTNSHSNNPQLKRLNWKLDGAIELPDYSRHPSKSTINKTEEIISN